ncbi:MAG: glycoside hydrolase family 43 protein [Clostridia bacterium]|nr:glycoside hydrolase family 43 protein [Clostridia bacterium]
MKKFLLFFTITLALCGVVFGMYMEYIHISEYPIFIESYDHGTLSVDLPGAQGDDGKYKVMGKKDSQVLININPERNDSEYYNLKMLTVNGEDVTDQVRMLQYTATVTQKLTVVATFEKGERPEEDVAVKKLSVTSPDIEKYASNAYLGSYSAYNIKDPSIIYDSDSGYFYCFGSNNVVIKSKDLVNWIDRTTYFKHPENAVSNTIMSFSQFDSVSSWANEHGYSGDELNSDKNQNRSPSAPEVVKVGKTYYLYYSIVKEQDANESAIFCVKTDNLKSAVDNKEWTDVGLVVSTCGTNGGTRTLIDADGNKSTVNIPAEYDKANATHPSVMYDGSKMYMAYGGYYGSGKLGGEIYLLELSTSTGLMKSLGGINGEGESVSTMHDGKMYKSGKLIADPGRVPALEETDGSLVSGADLVYNKDEGYYYLFVTYGYGDTNYNVVVSRSKKVEGPYTDFSGQDMASYSKGSMYGKGYMLMGGYNFVNSSKGKVSYTDVGRASIGAPSIIKTENGNWYIASQSQIYFKAGTEITTSSKKAEESSLMLASEPALEVRALNWNDEGWPMASPEVYAGKSKKDTKIKLDDLYGNWDVILFRNSGDEDDAKAVARAESQIVSLLEYATISQNDISNSNAINFSGAIKKDGAAFTFTLDSVTYTVYPDAVWDWELKEGSIVFTGIGSDGTAIWGKKKLSTTLGLYTSAFYYVYGKCEGTLAETYKLRTDELSINPSQAQIDICVNDMLADLKK